MSAPEFRLSPAGVLAARDERHEAGWMAPHWTVLFVPPGARCTRVGQHLSDDQVADWARLVPESVAPQQKSPSTG